MARCALILKISVAMLAFAANSILCRLALQGGHIDPLSFSSLRLASGAFVLSPFLFYHARTTLSLWRPLPMYCGIPFYPLSALSPPVPFSSAFPVWQC